MLPTSSPGQRCCCKCVDGYQVLMTFLGSDLGPCDLCPGPHEEDMPTNIRFIHWVQDLTWSP